MTLFNRMLACTIVVSVAGFCCSSVVGQSFDDLSLEAYEKQVNAILKTRLPAEKKFVSQLMIKVEKKEIPKS